MTRTTRISLIATATAMLAGCGFLHHGTETPWSARRAATYDGPECARALYTLKEMFDEPTSVDVADDPAPAVQILLATCTRKSGEGVYNHNIYTAPRIHGLDVERIYAAADDRALPVLEAAIASVQAASAAVDSTADPSDSPDAHQTASGGELAAALFFLRVLPEADVEAAVAAVELPAAAKATFLVLYARAAAQVEAALTPDQRTLWVDRAIGVYHDRAAHFAAYADDYRQLDQLIAQAAAARDDKARVGEVITGLEHLRSGFFARCGKLACRNQPLYAWATRELAQLHVLRGDAVASRAEAGLFARHGSWVAGLAQAVRVAQEAELQHEQDAWQRYQRALEGGNDEHTARTLVPDAPAGEPPGLAIEPEMSLPDYARALGFDAHDDSGEIASVVGKGAERTLRFKKLVTRGQQPYDCVESNKVIRIEADGTLEYDEHCKYRPYTNVEDTHAPVKVPAEEATELRAGDTATFVIDGDHARIIEVKRGDRIVQLRADRVKG